MNPLVLKKCKPCEGNVQPLTGSELETYLASVPEWNITDDGKSISREFGFPDFAKAMAFANKVATIAQEEWHHPDMRVGWGRVSITLQTHAIKGLSENDFIVAAKVGELPQ
ncbi:MAG: 4a-hydroxytetrahydrobiopterin dehydratase [Minisyncoccia bacterium]